jgi:protocatechuate 3,4-dioxygenase beta subunit
MSRSYRVVGILALVVASLLVTVSPAAAAGATGKNFTLPAVTKTTYSISGTVRVNATSAAVPNVDVYANSPTTYGSYTYGLATTNASGAFTISHLLPGSYTLKFDPPRATNLQHGYRTATGGFSVTTPGTVTITTASLSGVNIRLPGGFKISGKVTRTNGTSVIADADVSADGTSSSTPGSDDTTTDSAGNYTLMGLSPGSYTVSFGHDLTASNQTGCWYTGSTYKFSASCASHTAVVIGSANVAGVSPKIPYSLKITGNVMTRASTPAPIVDAWVYARGPSYESAYTDATGKYTIAGLNPGKYTVEVDGPYGTRVPNGYYYATGPNYWAMATTSASAVTISTSVTTLATIKPPTGYFITGKITNTSGVALDSVLVEAIGGAGTANPNPAAWTDASGNYTIGPVPAGTAYKIDETPTYSSDPTLQTGWYLNSLPNNFTAASASALTITVTADKIVNMRLPKGATISGIVKITGGSACNYCDVYALDLTGSAVAYTTASSSGLYALQGLSPGSYKVEAYPSDSIIDATHVRITNYGYYKSGLTPNYSATFAGGTAIAVS